MRTTLAMAVLSHTSGCTPVSPVPTHREPGETCGPADTAALELGLGSSIFHEVHPDKTPRCDLIHGPQGGYHSDLGIRVQGVDPDLHWTLDLFATVDGRAVGQSAFTPRLECLHADSPMVNVGIRLFWHEAPEVLHSQAATLSAHLSSDRGDVHEHQISVELIDPAQLDLDSGI